MPVAHTKKDVRPVPFHQFRPGAIIEFEVFEGEIFTGTVTHLVINGPRSFVAGLSEKSYSPCRAHPEGAVIKEGPHGTPLGANIIHAVRVIKHSENPNCPLKFEDDPWKPEQKAELAKQVKNGEIRRHGDHATFMWGGRIRMADLYLQEVMQSIQPWEIFDFHGFFEKASKFGIIKNSDSHAGATINVKRLKRFAQKNLNRFKLNTRSEKKAYEKEMREDYHRSLESDD